MSVISDRHRVPRIPVSGLSRPTEAQKVRTEGLERKAKTKTERVKKT